jgi:ABC-type multidrug transport system ATPase subunit
MTSNLRFNKSRVFWFVGPNGAGKTTTMSMLYGLKKPTREMLVLVETVTVMNVNEDIAGVRAV